MCCVPEFTLSQPPRTHSTPPSMASNTPLTAASSAALPSLSTSLVAQTASASVAGYTAPATTLVAGSSSHKRKANGVEDESKHGTDEDPDPVAAGFPAAAAHSTGPPSLSGQSKRSRIERPHDPQTCLDAAAASPVASCESPPAANSAMLHYLARDTGASFTVLSFLFLDEISELHATCRTWRSWIAAPSSCLCRELDVRPSRFAPLMACSWLRPKLQLLLLLSETHSGSLELLRNVLESSLLGLFAFPKLEALKFQLRVNRVSESVLRTCFAVLAPRLISLQIDLMHADPGSGIDYENEDSPLTFVQLVMHEVIRLPKLEVLWITGHTHDLRDAEAISFEALPQLTALREFGIETRSDNYWATSAQVNCLAQCKWLEMIHFGRWCKHPDRLLSPDPVVDEAMQLAESIGVLVAAIEERLRERRDALGSPITVVLVNSNVSSAFWTYLCRIPCFERLWPNSFDRLSSMEWKGLSKFSQITSLRIAPSDTPWAGVMQRSAMQVDDFLSALLECPKLEDIFFRNMALSSKQLEQICRPQLTRLTLQRMWVASLLPLGSATQLRDLSIVECVDSESNPLLVRVSLPPMAALEELDIGELLEHQLTESEAAPLNAALLARCPLLRASRIQEEFREE